MSVTKPKFVRGIRIKPDNQPLENVDGEIKVDSVDNKIKTTLGGSAKEILTNDQAQTLTNKTIDVDNNTVSNIEVDNLKAGVLNTSTTLTGASDTQIPSAKAVRDYVDAGLAEQDSASEIINVPAGTIAATNVQDAINELDGDIQAHINDTVGAHAASAIANTPSGNLAATDVQGALNELQSDVDTRALDSALTDHINDTTDAHDASAISVTPTGNLAADDVQEALVELQGDIDTTNGNVSTVSGDLSTHVGASTDVHGLSGGAAVVGTTSTQTLSNKTLTAPVINNGSATGTSVVTPARLDAKQDTKANLITYATTAANGQFVFATDEKKMYQVVDGLLAQVGGGSQGLDTIFQLFADEELSDWSTGNNASFLGGGTFGGNFLKETVAPLNGDASYVYSQNDGSINDYIASPVQEVPIRFRGQTNTVSFVYSYNGTNNDIVPVIYDVTNASVIIGSSQTDGYALAATNGGVKNYQANFTIPLSCTQIRFGFQLKNSITEEAILRFDDIEVGNDLTVTDTFDTGSIGEITPFAGPIDTEYYLECAGQAVSRITYGDLFNKIGITHGQGDGSTTFNLPDYRGRFLRGVAGASTLDPDKLTRTAMNTGGNTGNLVGSVQADGFASHTHASQSGVGFGVFGAGSAFTAATGPNTVQIQANTAATGGNETRPENAYVNYGIRYRTNSSYIITPTESFSTDTAQLTYAPSSTYTLSTLANAPVGTYITFTYAANTNTRTQTTVRPTQTDADMNVNGILLYHRAYNETTTAALPTSFAIQIGKGFKGHDIAAFKSASKTTQALFFNLFGSGKNGAIESYDEKTGTLFIDARFDPGAASTAGNGSFIFIDGTTQLSAYLVINASKSPALTGVPALIPRIATLSDVKASGTAGGTATAGAYQTRTLNTIDDPTGIVTSLTGNQFILPAGEYYIEAKSNGAAVAQHKIKIRNISDSSDSIVGISAFTASGITYTTLATLVGKITISSSKVFELQHRVASTKSADGFGVASSFGDNEVYTQVKIIRVR